MVSGVADQIISRKIRDGVHWRNLAHKHEQNIFQLVTFNVP